MRALFVGDSNKHQKSAHSLRKLLSRKKWWFIGILVIIIGGALTVWLIISSQESAKSQKTALQAQESKNAKETVVKADKIAFQGDSKKAASLLDGAISKTTSGDNKSKLLTEKALILCDSNNLDDALKAAIDNYNIKQTLSSASLVGRIAQKKGDTAMAKQYYTIALKLVDNSDSLAGSDKAYLQGILNGLDQSK
jgi:cytoskeletal protein RodZ